VKLVRSRLANRIDYSTGPTELRAIRVRQHLKFRDRFDAQRSAADAGACSVSPEICNVRVVEQECLADGSRSGYRIVVLVPVERIASALTCGVPDDPLYAWRERQKLLKVSAIQGQVLHLRTRHERRYRSGLRFYLRNLALDRYSLRCLADR
jgi:hypothetical protein